MEIRLRPQQLQTTPWSTVSPRVVVIGSDSVVSRALQLFLRSEGYDTTVVGADGAGWQGGRAAVPDLVLVTSTVLAPRRAEIWTQLKRDPETQHVPLVALLDLADSVDSSTMDYADAVLTWPFRLKEVLVLIEELLTPPGSRIAG